MSDGQRGSVGFHGRRWLALWLATWGATWGATVAAATEPPGGAAADASVPGTYWVRDAWLEVRSAPTADASVLAGLPFDTALQVERQQAGWCSVRSEVERLSGFAPCDRLGAAPLDRKAFFAGLRRGEGPENQDEFEFWLAPSARRLAQVGERLNYRVLSAEQSKRQEETQTPLRFKLPRFEAMKRRLAAGVVPVAENELARLNVRTFEPLSEFHHWQLSGELIEYVRSLDPGRHLPKVSASRFRQHADVLLSGETSADAIAMMTGRANEVRYGGKPEWVNGHHGAGVSALWDIRRIELRYAQPVTLHSVSGVGLLGARTLHDSAIIASSENDGCREGYAPLPEGRPLPGYPRLKQQPLLSFVLPNPLVEKQVEVLTRKARIVVHRDPYSGPKNPQPQAVLVHTLDLDRDGIADLAVMEWSTPGPVSEQPSSSRYLFINVAGEWWFSGHESYGECT